MYTQLYLYFNIENKISSVDDTNFGLVTCDYSSLTAFAISPDTPINNQKGQKSVEQ